MVLVPLSVHTFSSLLVVASLRLALVFFNTSPVPHTTLVFGVVSAPSLPGMDTGCSLVQWSTDCAPHTLRRAAMRLEVCGGESYKGTVDSRCPGGREGRGRGCKTWWSSTCTFGRSLGGGEGVGGPWEEEREWEVLGRRVSGRSLGGGEGVGGPWGEEREWEVLGRRRGSGRSLGGREGVGARSLGGGEGVGGPWEDEREWELGP